MRLLRYIRGYCKITVTEENTAPLLSFLMKEKISFTPTKAREMDLSAFIRRIAFPRRHKGSAKRLNAAPFSRTCHAIRKGRGWRQDFSLRRR